MRNFSLSVVVLTKNEENNIAACLESVYGWADEILLVDDESTDKTVEFAQKYSPVLLQSKMDNEGKQRNWAYAQARYEWVLSLDVDEQVTQELKDEIDSVLDNAQVQAFAIPLRNYIGDYWIKHGGWYPASKIKLFKPECFRYEEVEVHPKAYVDGQTSQLTRDIIHKSYRDFEHFFEKLNSQTTREALKWARTGQNITRGKIIRRSIDRFFRAFFRKKGLKDGLIGFILAFGASLYQIMSYAKYWEMRQSFGACRPSPEEDAKTEKV